MTNNNTNDTKILDLNQTMNDFIVGLMKQTMERLMQEELSNVLQYEKYSYDGHGTGNSRNGAYARVYETRYGTIHDLKIPRDRNNEFSQQLIPPYARRDDWLENLIIRMYASGVSTRGIAGIIEKLYGNSYSAATISNITDVAIDEVDKWHKREIKKRYSIIYIDDLHVKLRRTTVDLDAVYFISKIHSSSQKDYKSANAITFQAMEQGAALFGKATFAMDRGYDDNKMFQKMDELKQDYVIRLKSNRKLLYHNKWTMATELRNRRKCKVKTNVFYKGKDHEAYLSHVKVQITASRKDIYLVLVYGITEHPMMLDTNKEINSKDDVIRVARTYFSRWKIEEYFRCKKQMFQFENFRVRKLKAINALNFYITLCMAFLAIISMESETNALKVSIIKTADPIKEKVFFCYYRLAKGISGILSYAKEGVRLWFRTKRPVYRQLCLKLAT